MGKLSTILSVAALAGVGYYVGKKVFEKKKAEEADRAEKIALGEMDESEIFVEEKHSTPKEKIQKASLFAVGAIKTGTEKFKEGIDEIINSDMVTKGETTVSDVKVFAAEKKEQAGAFVAEKKEQATAFASEKTAAFKNEIDNLKNMVSSINTAPGEAEEDIIDAEAVAEDEDADVPAEDIEVEVEGIPTAEEIAEVKAEAAEAMEEIAEIAEETIEDIVETAEEIAVTDTEDVTDEASMAMEAADEAVDELAEASKEIADDIADFAESIADDADDLDDISFSDMETVDTFDFGSADKL